MVENTPEIAIVVAMDQKKAIGKNGELPWPRIPDDMKRFRNITMGYPVIMGRKTYDSIPEKFRPLPERPNIVVTRQDREFPGCSVAHSLDEAIQVASALNARRICIIGGGEIYTQAINFANTLYLTLIDKDFQGDVTFPDYSQFNKVISEQDGESEGLKYKFLDLEKTSP